MNFYKRHIGDYIKKTAHLSLLEHGIYSRLIDVYYTREAPIPGDQVARLIGARSKEEKEAMLSILGEFFVECAGSWRHTRCEQEIATANQKAERNREVGLFGGRPTKKETIMVPENNHDGYLSEPTDNPSQTPDSSNQRKEEKHTSASPPPCPYGQIIDLYHEILPTCPQVRELSEKRKRYLQARWRAKVCRQNLEWWRRFFEHVAKSDFLTGKAQPTTGRNAPFIADLEWLTTEGHFIHVVEGKYHDEVTA